MNKLVYIMCGLLIVGSISCAALSEYITPADISPQAVDYVAKSGVADANEFKGYANLYKANKLAHAISAAYQVNSLALQQLQEKNNLDYTVLNDAMIKSLEVAKAREEQLFGEAGLLSMGLGLLGFGGLGGVIGLMRKRPGDITPQEMEQALGEVKVEVTNRDRQIIELVKGVQNFIDTTGDGTVLKNFLAMAQSTDTKQTVAQIKATL